MAHMARSLEFKIMKTDYDPDIKQKLRNKHVSQPLLKIGKNNSQYKLGEQTKEFK